MKTDFFSINGPVLFTPRKFGDNRGYFMETFRQSVFDAAAGETSFFVQDNQSLSASLGTVRGLHYQAPPQAQGKLVRCSRGSIIDVGVDIRKGSPTYGQYVRAELTADNAKQLWLPPGFLHGFSTLTDDVVVQYKCTDYFSAECEGSVAWDDPDIGIDWGLGATKPIISEKDAQARPFRDFDSPF